MFANIIYLYGMQAVNYIIPLVVLPYLIRVLGPVEYGRLGFVLSIVQYIVLITDYGFNLYSSSQIAKNQRNKNKISEIYCQTILSKFFIFFWVLIILIVLTMYNGRLKSVDWLIYIALVQVIGTIITPIWLFQGLEVMKKFAVLNISSKLLCLPLVFIFVKNKHDVVYAVLFQTSVYLVSGLTSLFIVKQYGIRFISVKFSSIIASLRSASTIFLGTFSISLYTLSTPILIGFLSSDYELGIYSAADKVRAALLGLFVILGNVFYPRIQRLMHEDTKAAYVLIRKILKYQIIFCLFAAVVFYFMSPFIVRFYLGSQFQGAEFLLKIMTPMILLIPSSIILSNYILLPLGYRKIFGVVPVFTACIHLSYAIFLIKNNGSIGASLAVLLTEIFSFTILFVINYKLGNFKVIGLLRENS